MDSLPEFTLAELVELENTYKDIGEESLNAEFCQRLASSFSFSAKRTGKPAIAWEQVQSWFQEKHKEKQGEKLKEKQASLNLSPLGLELLLGLSNESCLNHPPETPGKSKGGKVTDLSDLSFEAKSWRDEAWYDVASFLNYRVLHTGELEARVRFVGFANTHDEWVNVKTAVRERSIPLEPQECHKVKIGDLILCFREGQDHALYSDAHIIGIQRRQHETTECTCRFMVRFEYDDAEEYVLLPRICRRPTASDHPEKITSN
ncbi:protein SAWADEE HOMEODOMAIN HOMOLOG 1 [Euphorbia lathyris]|uniref:protein SAWADEE HOMEODOMAIN HOMOLOG 1 n=1 Tax=Euphorbia lathyris TaxID=212925 RepID=UPI0033136D33